VHPPSAGTFPTLCGGGMVILCYFQNNLSKQDKKSSGFDRMQLEPCTVRIDMVDCTADTDIRQGKNAEYIDQKKQRIAKFKRYGMFSLLTFKCKKGKLSSL
jgi:predicted membrane metal-binding protein